MLHRGPRHPASQSWHVRPRESTTRRSGEEGTGLGRSAASMSNLSLELQCVALLQMFAIMFDSCVSNISIIRIIQSAWFDCQVKNHDASQDVMSKSQQAVLLRCADAKNASVSVFFHYIHSINSIQPCSLFAWSILELSGRFLTKSLSEASLRIGKDWHSKGYLLGLTCRSWSANVSSQRMTPSSCQVYKLAACSSPIPVIFYKFLVSWSTILHFDCYQPNRDPSWTCHHIYKFM